MRDVRNQQGFKKESIIVVCETSKANGIVKGEKYRVAHFLPPLVVIRISDGSQVGIYAYRFTLLNNNDQNACADRCFWCNSSTKMVIATDQKIQIRYCPKCQR